MLLTFTDHEEYADAAKAWRITVIAATADAPPAEAVLLRPDGDVAWAAGTTDDLAQTLQTWF